ncbi:hypothetical protein P7C73_g3482, partial [Tremellales sp. Uapishka_1]
MNGGSVMSPPADLPSLASSAMVSTNGNAQRGSAGPSQETEVESTPASSATLRDTTPEPPRAYPQPAHPSPPAALSATASTSKLPIKTLSAHLAANPHHSPAKAISKQFPFPNPLFRLINRFRVKHSVISGLSDKELAYWEKKGPELRRKAGWKLEDEAGDGCAVSPLFWKMYISLLPTLQRDPLSGLVPPDLLGSTTTMPLSIISLIPDIMQHYADVIIRAESEIFLATNYWQPSNSVNTISKSLRDLSIKVKKEKRERVVVKIMYDRGSWEQLWNAHAFVDPKMWTPLDLPSQEEVDGLDLQVINFHRVLLGTFHAKFLVVDRKVALINSNNIQDRPNLELMTHLEGPIVDAFYEIALHSWHNKLSPPLPCIGTPYKPPVDIHGRTKYLFTDHNPYFDDIEILKAARAARLLLRRQTRDIDDERQHASNKFVDVVRKAMAEHAHNFKEWTPGEELEMRAMNAMRELRDFRDKWGLGSRAGSRPGSRRTSQTDLATLGRSGQYQTSETEAITAANAQLTLPDNEPSPTLNESIFTSPRSKTYPCPNPQLGKVFASDDADSRRTSLDHPHVMFAPLKTEGLGLEKDRVMVDSPVEMSEKKVDGGAEGEGKGEGEGLPVTAKMPDEIKQEQPLPEGTGSRRMFQLSTKFNAGALSEAWATVEDSDELDQFRPHVVHAPHDPFPIAMCCRKPHGFPGHHDIRNPQNAAWLAGFRYAKRKVFVQTPTLNARPIVRAIKQACRRGVEVILLLDLGFNDKGESIPFQGGTNEEVVVRLYKKLKPEGKEKYLKVYWYTGKDQVRPLNAVKKQRNCHIKFAAYDDEVLIIGNGNQDSQSWFHSQEVNVMLYSKQIVAEMMDTLLLNQNTMKYGLVDTDGIWRDKDGKTLEDYGATEGGKYRGLAGFIQFAKTI